MSKLLPWKLLSLPMALAISGPAMLHAQAAGVLAGRPECPHDWDLKEGQLPLIGSDIDVPELHDCQRFIRRDSLRRFVYDSLFAIWAAPNLEDLEDRLPTGPSESEAFALAVAELYAEGEYRPLGIPKRFSCLYLARYSSGDSVVWTAKMVPVRDENSDCRGDTLFSNLAGAILQVRRTAAQNFSKGDYPGSARWDWDASQHEQYIGVTCGASWCEIGRRGFGESMKPWPTRVAEITLGLPTKLRRTRVVKGWYDQQILAVGTPANPSLLMGTIYPDSALDGRRHQDFESQWVPVAHVALEVLGAPGLARAQYKNSLNFDLTPTIGRLNTMYLCNGGLNGGLFECIRALDRLEFPVASPSDAEIARLRECNGGGSWWGMIHATDGTVGLRCVVHRSHRNLVLHRRREFPGTVRWRWTASDETTWDWCPMGCCETQGKQ